jgi:hypothetical protein
MPKATSKGGDFTPVPAGIHHGVCYAVIDLGTQPSTMYAPSRKVLLIWELPHERGDFKDQTGAIKDLPRVISKEYTLSTGTKSNLRKELESWRGRPFTAEEAQEFEVGNLVGKNCQLNVAHRPSKDGTKTYANVISIVPLAKGTKAMQPENEIMVYDLPSDGPITFPPSMPEWIQNKIKNSEEYSESVNPQRKNHALTDEEKYNISSAEAMSAHDDDVPF